MSFWKFNFISNYIFFYISFKFTLICIFISFKTGKSYTWDSLVSEIYRIYSNFIICSLWSSMHLQQSSILENTLGFGVWHHSNNTPKLIWRIEDWEESFKFEVLHPHFRGWFYLPHCHFLFLSYFLFTTIWSFIYYTINKKNYKLN